MGISHRQLISNSPEKALTGMKLTPEEALIEADRLPLILPPDPSAEGIQEIAVTGQDTVSWVAGQYEDTRKKVQLQRGEQ